MEGTGIKSREQLSTEYIVKRCQEPSRLGGGENRDFFYVIAKKLDKIEERVKDIEEKQK